MWRWRWKLEVEVETRGLEALGPWCLEQSYCSALLKSGDEALALMFGADFRACKVDLASRRRRRLRPATAAMAASPARPAAQRPGPTISDVAWTGSSERNKTWQTNVESWKLRTPLLLLLPPLTEDDRMQIIQCTYQLRRCPCCQHYSAS